VAAIHAITDRTTERIRAVLNEEQKKLYSQPLPTTLPRARASLASRSG